MNPSYLRRWQKHHTNACSGADEMSAIRQIEKGQHCAVDNLLNIFMKGCAAENRDEHLIAGFMKI